MDSAAATENDYNRLLGRLSEQSVRKHFDAYADVAWDDPALCIEAQDPRWELPLWDELGGSEWYRAQSEVLRRRMGLHLIAGRFKIGWQFENVLQRGLLTFVERLPNHSKEFRYAHHEIIEESQHSLMFQEFIDRSGIDVPTFPWWMRIGNRPVIGSAAYFPEFFFLNVLAGEEPIDYLQRKMLRREHDNLHPLLRRIMQIHVLEESRHVCFARQYLRKRLASASPLRRNALRRLAPFVFYGTAITMLRPLPDFVLAYRIPAPVLRAAYRDNPRHRQLLIDSLANVRALCTELDLLTPRTLPFWQQLGAA